MAHPAVDKFGRLIVTSLRDRAIEHYDLVAKRHWKAPRLQSLQDDLAGLTPDQQRIVRRCVVDAIDTALHDFLFAIGQAHDHGEGIEILVNGANIAEISDGLHGEQFGEDGWIVKFGKYPEGTGDPRDSA